MRHAQHTHTRAQVNWQTLWMGRRQREMRELLVLPFLIGIIIFPIGLIGGAWRSCVCVCVCVCVHRHARM